MFELGIARKYLIPKRKQLTMSLIALMSVGVITLVVWLVLLFLSVIEGIEHEWLHKLTSMNGPVRVSPTPAYYNSYYYQVDAISGSSNFSLKSLGEKLARERTDPYSPESDIEVPTYWPEAEKSEDGSLKDLAKAALSAITRAGDVTAQEYETTGALLRLKLVRTNHFGQQEQGSLTQATYITSLASRSKGQRTLLAPPRIADLNHLASTAELDTQDHTSDIEYLIPNASAAAFQKRLKSLFAHANITKWRSLDDNMPLAHTLFPNECEMKAVGVFVEGKLNRILLSEKAYSSDTLVSGTLIRKGDEWTFQTKDAAYRAHSLPIFSDSQLTFRGEPTSLQGASRLRDVRIAATIELQGYTLSGLLPWHRIEIAEATPSISFDHEPEVAPLWVYEVGGETRLPQAGVILPDAFQENGVHIGDTGYFSYAALAPSTVQEQRLPFTIAGFYKPGVMSIGPKSVIADSETLRDISAGHTFDKSMGNGIGVWFDNLKQASQVKHDIKEALAQEGLSPYFEVTSFEEYDFAKDLLQQFQSDKYLFTLIGGIILLVACSNIISLLVILVNDKRKEIGILQSMGASQMSIAATFALCGGAIGLLSTLIGAGAAYFTLHNIDSVVALLSKLQGQTAFNALFYGDSLPNTMSGDALLFIAIATPIISIIAGLIPAIKACSVKPAATLRAE